MKFMNRKRVFGAVFALVGVFALSACSTQFTDPSMVALRYEGGLTEGGKFVECVEPGTKRISNDTYYPYPTTQREDVWDSENFERGANSADQNDLEVIDKDGNVANLKIKVVFTLTTECKVLQEFHEKIGRTRKAWFNDDGSYGDGWLWAMNNYIGSAVSEKARSVATNYTVDQMWLDPKVRTQMANSMMETLQNAVNDGTEGDSQFYNIGSVRIFGAAPEEEFRKLYSERKSAQVKADTAEANRLARVAEAKANAQVAQEEAKIRKAEIDGFGDTNSYLKYLMVEKGMNPFQPNYGGVVTTTK